MDLVRSEVRGSVVLLTLNRPKTLNPLDAGTLEAIEAHCQDVAAAGTARCGPPAPRSGGASSASSSC